jgi:hypothetical protein
MVQGEQDRDFQREQGAVSHAQSMEMHNAEAQQAQQMQSNEMAAAPLAESPQGQAPAASEAAPVDLNPIVDQMAADAAQTQQMMQAMVQAMTQGFQQMMQQQAQAFAALMQKQQESEDEIIDAMTAEKEIVRGEDGFARGVTSKYQRKPKPTPAAQTEEVEE